MTVAFRRPQSSVRRRPVRRSLRALVLAGLLVGVLPVVLAEETGAMMDKSMSGVPIEGEHDPSVCSPDGIGVGGYDLVSYRQPLGPRRGSPDFAAEHEGLTYLFVSDEHRGLFLEDPAYYLPLYSGWCAITLALGRLTCPDYENFKIERDRLLLFEVTGFTNGRTVWETDPLSFREQADANYDRLKMSP